MALTVNINGDKKVVVPQCWQETLLWQYQNLKSIKDTDYNDLSIFCAFTGASYDEVATSDSDEIHTALYQLVSWVHHNPEYFRSNEVPRVLHIDGSIISVPKKLGKLSIEQNMVIRQAINQPNMCLEQLISIAIAVYMQPLVDGQPFDKDRALEIEKEILQMPVEYVFPIGFFFLRRLNEYGLRGTNFFSSPRMWWIKLKLKLRNKLASRLSWS